MTAASPGTAGSGDRRDVWERLAARHDLVPTPSEDLVFDRPAGARVVPLRS